MFEPLRQLVESLRQVVESDLSRQVGELVLGSVPTMLIFLVLVGSYMVLLYKPLKRTLAERRERTEGAVAHAHSLIAAADAESQEYEARLRAARLEIFARREKQVQEWNAARDAAVTAARAEAHRKVVAARGALVSQTEASKASLQSSVDALASEILRVLLTSAAAPRAAAGSQEQAG